MSADAIKGVGMEFPGDGVIDCGGVPANVTARRETIQVR